MKPVYRTAFAAASLLTIATLIGTIHTATSDHYNATPAVIGAGVTVGLAVIAWIAWHEARRL